MELDLGSRWLWLAPVSGEWRAGQKASRPRAPRPQVGASYWDGVTAATGRSKTGALHHSYGTAQLPCSSLYCYCGDREARGSVRTAPAGCFGRGSTGHWRWRTAVLHNYCPVGRGHWPVPGRWGGLLGWLARCQRSHLTFTFTFKQPTFPDREISKCRADKGSHRTLKYFSFLW